MLYKLLWITNETLHCGSNLLLLNMMVTLQRGYPKVVVEYAPAVTPSLIIRT
jgi:hypothetical protein